MNADMEHMALVWIFIFIFIFGGIVLILSMGDVNWSRSCKGNELEVVFVMFPLYGCFWK